METTAQRIALLFGGVAHTEAKETDDHIVGVYRYLVVADTDTIAGRSLPGNGNIVIPDPEGGLQCDSARYFEQHIPRPRSLYRGA